MSFGEFIAPFNEKEFRESYLGKRPLHIHRAKTPGEILDWAGFNQALAVTPYWTEDTLKVFYKNRASLRDSYCDATDGRGKSAPVNPEKLKALTALGATVVANYAHRVSPSIDAVVHMLEQALGARVFANVYCSFKDVQAFRTHYDLHDVFAFQAEGEKLWRIYEARADAPVSALPPGDETERWLTESRGQLLFEATMTPGDILYLPRGQYHDAITQDGASLHVTFGIDAPNGLALFKLLEAALAGDSAFRHYLPDARDTPALCARLAALAERVAAMMTSPAFALDVLNHQRGLATPTAGYAFPRQETSRWFTVAAPARVARTDAGFTLVSQSGQIDIGSGYQLVEWMLRQGRFSLQDAASHAPLLPEAEFQRLLSLLLQAGVVVETPIR